MTLYNVAIYNYYEFSQLYPNDLYSIELPWYRLGDKLQNVLQDN